MTATTYPAEGVVILYALLVGSQIYLVFLAALGYLPALGRITTTLTYATLACAFLLLALGTIQPPLIDLVRYRWMLRGSFTAYFLMSVYALGQYWLGLLRSRRRTRESIEGERG